MGPGFLRGDADLRGFSVAHGTSKWFFPLFYPEDNYHDPGAALAWLDDICGNDHIDKVFHNAMYDLEALDSVKINVHGGLHDTMVMNVLIDDEARSSSLDACAKHWLGETKDEALLIEAAAAFGIDPKAEMWKLPARYVGPYGEADADLPLRLYDLMSDAIDEFDMNRLLRLEQDVIRLTWEMRKRGVRVDVERAEELNVRMKQDVLNHLDNIMKQVGWAVDPWSGKSLERLCKQERIKFPHTAKGNPSFTNDWLAAQQHPVLQQLAECRRVAKMRRDFVEGQILRYEINGRVHGQFHSTRRDEGGTRSGRFSSSNPNLQQVPGRDPIYGPLIRGLYIPDEGAEWGKFDYSSQEPRITLHFANINNIQGAAEFVERYRADPRFCQHQYAADILGQPRPKTKGLNLGITYGMGIEKMAGELDTDTNEAWALKKEYNKAMPFV